MKQLSNFGHLGLSKSHPENTKAIAYYMEVIKRRQAPVIPEIIDY